jgi:hypothetical protein
LGYSATHRSSQRNLSPRLSLKGGDFHFSLNLLRYSI